MALLSRCRLSRRRGRSGEIVAGWLEILGSSKRDTHPQNCNSAGEVDICTRVFPLSRFRPQIFSWRLDIPVRLGFRVLFPARIGWRARRVATASRLCEFSAMEHREHVALRRRDRARLEAAGSAICAAKNSIRIDGCGDPAMSGRRGHIFAISEPIGGAALRAIVFCRTMHGWSSAKRRLGAIGWRLAQDGDDEGVMTLDRLPSLCEGADVRAVLGIRKSQPAREGLLANLGAAAE